MTKLEIDPSCIYHCSKHAYIAVTKDSPISCYLCFNTCFKLQIDRTKEYDTVFEATCYFCNNIFSLSYDSGNPQPVTLVHTITI